MLDRQHQTEGLLAREPFTFDPVRDHYICPQGKILKHRTAREENRIHIYRATASDCKECPIRPQCMRGAKRTLSVPFDESARQEAMALHNTEAFRHSRRLRRKVGDAVRSHETAPSIQQTQTERPRWCCRGIRTPRHSTELAEADQAATANDPTDSFSTDRLKNDNQAATNTHKRVGSAFDNPLFPFNHRPCNVCLRLFRQYLSFVNQLRYPAGVKNPNQSV